MSAPLLKLGEHVDRNGWKGKVASIHFTGGERYYFLIQSDNTVAMVPAFALEVEEDR